MKTSLVEHKTSMDSI